MNFVLFLFILVINHCKSHVQVAEVRCELSRQGSCDQCPMGRFLLHSNGSLLCCDGCGPMAERVDTSECFCLKTSSNDHNSNSKTIDVRNSQPRILAGGQQVPINNRIDDQRHTLRLEEAVNILIDAVEKLSARVQYLENLHNRDTGVNRVGVDGTWTDNLAEPSISCSSRFTPVGDMCLYFSTTDDTRKTWIGANQTCSSMSSILVEPQDLQSYEDLKRHIVSNKRLNGFSFWTGGLFLGISWRWWYEGTEVSSQFWSTGYFRPTEHERCLVLRWLYDQRNSYTVYPAPCGNEKYFICQELTRSHRSL